MREASRCRTATDTDSRALLLSKPINRQRGDDRGNNLIMTIYLSCTIKRLLTLMTLMSMSISVFAQFYDSDDEVRIYVQKSSYDNPGNYPSIMVFNFNGAKAAKLDVNGEKVLEDENYFEKRIFAQGNEIINFHEEGSNYERIRYRRTHTSYNYSNPALRWGEASTTYSNYDFSSSGSELISPNKTMYIRISKDKYIEMLLAFKNKTSKRWR